MVLVAVMEEEAWPVSVELAEVKVVPVLLPPPARAVMAGASPASAVASPPAVTASTPLPEAAKLDPWRVAVKVAWSLLELAIRRTEVAATSLVVVELKVAEAVEP